MKRTAPSMTVSIREFELLKNNSDNALLIMVCLDKDTKTAKDITEYGFKDIKKFEISHYRIWFRERSSTS